MIILHLIRSTYTSFIASILNLHTYSSFLCSWSDNRKRTLEEPSTKPDDKKKKKVVKKINPTLSQRIEILDWFHSNGKKQTKTATHFIEKYPELRFGQPRLSEWLKDEKKMRDEYNAGLGLHSKRKTSTEHPQVNHALETWVTQAEHLGMVLTGPVIRAMWKRFADLFKIPEEDCLNLSDGWLTSFKNRTGLRSIRRHGEAGSASSDTVNAERARVRAITDLYLPANIYNMDETGLFYG